MSLDITFLIFHTVGRAQGIPLLTMKTTPVTVVHLINKDFEPIVKGKLHQFYTSKCVSRCWGVILNVKNCMYYYRRRLQV